MKVFAKVSAAGCCCFEMRGVGLEIPFAKFSGEYIYRIHGNALF